MQPPRYMHAGVGEIVWYIEADLYAVETRNRLHEGGQECERNKCTFHMWREYIGVDTAAILPAVDVSRESGYITLRLSSTLDTRSIPSPSKHLSVQIIMSFPALHAVP